MRLWSISEAVYGQNLTATVFHRTKRLVGIKNIAAFGFKAGPGAMYGKGLYTTFDIESQMKDGMIKTYGEYIVKFVVKNLDQYLCFDPETATKIHGSPSIDEQMRKFGIEASGFDTFMIPGGGLKRRGSDLAQQLLREVGEHDVMSKVKGLIFEGRRDGKVLVKYDPVDDGSIVMAAYAYCPRPVSPDELQWNTSSSRASYKSIYKMGVGDRRYKLANSMSSTDEPIVSKHIRIRDMLTSGVPITKQDDIDWLMRSKSLKIPFISSVVNRIKSGGEISHIEFENLNILPKDIDFSDASVHGLFESLYTIKKASGSMNSFYDDLSEVISLANEKHSSAAVIIRSIVDQIIAKISNATNFVKLFGDDMWGKANQAPFSKIVANRVIELVDKNPELQDYDNFVKIIPERFLTIYKVLDIVLAKKDMNLALKFVDLCRYYMAIQKFLLGLSKYKNVSTFRSAIELLVKRYLELYNPDADASLNQLCRYVKGSVASVVADIIPTEKLPIMINNLSRASLQNEEALSRIINKLGGDLNSILLKVVQFKDMNFAIKYLVKLGANNFKEALAAAKTRKAKNQIKNLMSHNVSVEHTYYAPMSIEEIALRIK